VIRRKIDPDHASEIHDRRSATPAYDRCVRDVSGFVDEIANKLATWPGVRFDHRTDGVTIVRTGH
jgi:hypothetical protein